MLVAVLAMGGCGDDDGDEPAGKPSAPVARIRYPDGVDGLEKLAGDLLGAAAADRRQPARLLAASLELPDPRTWFEGHFAPEVAARLTAEYEPMRGRTSELASLLTALAAEGRTLVAVERFDDPDSPEATGYQALALRAMTTKTPLYSLRLRKDGEGEGFHLWSLVHDGDSFRWVGKLKAITGRPPPPDPDPLELRVRSVPR